MFRNIRDRTIDSSRICFEGSGQCRHGPAFGVKRTSQTCTTILPTCWSFCKVSSTHSSHQALASHLTDWLLYLCVSVNVILSQDDNAWPHASSFSRTSRMSISISTPSRHTCKYVSVLSTSVKASYPEGENGDSPRPLTFCIFIFSRRYNDDDFNWNYGLSLAATGNYKAAEVGT